MKGYFGLGQMSTDEKSNILDQHRQIYNGYQTMQPKVLNTQPLYVQDFAGDKNGITMSNKGEMKHYTNVGINEQVEKSKVCNECGGMMYEGECSECGGGMMYESAECSECGGMMYEGECSECGYKGQMDEETGHLDDIYNQKDLNLKHGDFDYVEGGGNDYGTFEKMHHMKEQADDYVNYEDNLDEQGGNADDMDVDDVEPAFDFESEGPGMGDAYPVNEEGNMDEPEITYDAMESAFNDDEMGEQDISGVQGIYGDMDPAFDFDSEGPGKAGPYQHSQYESENGETEEQYLPKHVWDDAHKKGHVKTHKELGIDSDDDFDEDELEIDFDEFDPRDKSWEEITAHTGDDEFGGVDEDIKESLITQKNRIMEMMNRMNVIK
jgi:hypothetical protein